MILVYRVTVDIMAEAGNTLMEVMMEEKIRPSKSLWQHHKSGLTSAPVGGLKEPKTTEVPLAALNCCCREKDLSLFVSYLSLIFFANFFILTPLLLFCTLLLQQCSFPTVVQIKFFLFSSFSYTCRSIHLSVYPSFCLSIYNVCLSIMLVTEYLCFLDLQLSIILKESLLTILICNLLFLEKKSIN